MDIVDADVHVVSEDGEVLETLAGADRGGGLGEHRSRTATAAYADLARARHVCKPRQTNVSLNTPACL